MRQYTTIETQKTMEEMKLSVIICNQCGKEIQIPSDEEGTFQADVAKAEVFAADYSWGYGSKYDMERHQFDLCETCYEKLIEGFQVKIERK